MPWRRSKKKIEAEPQLEQNLRAVLEVRTAGNPDDEAVVWSARQYLFKQDLQNLVNLLGLEIRVAHYPSYCSKYNPIERRLFPHVGRACEGMLFDTLDTVVGLIRKASTSTGLKTTVNVIRRAYETGRKIVDDFKTNMPIVFDEQLPKWNYRAVPE